VSQYASTWHPGKPLLSVPFLFSLTRFLFSLLSVSSVCLLSFSSSTCVLGPLHLRPARHPAHGVQAGRADREDGRAPLRALQEARPAVHTVCIPLDELLAHARNILATRYSLVGYLFVRTGWRRVQNLPHLHLRLFPLLFCTQTQAA